MFINKLRHCRKVQEGLALMDKDRFRAFTHDEMWTFLRRGLRSPLARAGVASVMATKELREDFEKAQIHIWTLIEQEMEFAKLPAPRSVQEADSDRRSETPSGEPWVFASGDVDVAGIRAGKYDQHLGGFTVPPGRVSDAAWKALHPMVRRKKYLATHNADGTRKGGRGGGGRGGGKKRTVAELETELAEANKKIKGLEEGRESLEADADDEERSNAGNPALEAHGGTRNRFRKRAPP